MECGGRAQRRPRFCFFHPPAVAYKKRFLNPNRSTMLPLPWERAGMRGTATFECLQLYRETATLPLQLLNGYVLIGRLGFASAVNLNGNHAAHRDDIFV